MMHSQVCYSLPLKNLEEAGNSDDGTAWILEDGWSLEDETIWEDGWTSEGKTGWNPEGIDEQCLDPRNQKYECTALSGMDSYNSQKLNKLHITLHYECTGSAKRLALVFMHQWCDDL